MAGVSTYRAAMARSLGASAGRGFSTSVSMRIVPPPRSVPPTMPYRLTLSGGTRSRPMTAVPSRRWASASCTIGGTPPAKTVSASRQANGSPPTAARAASTASPSPRCSCCITAPTRTRASSSSTLRSSPALPAAFSRRRSGSFGSASKWASSAGLSGLVTSVTSVMPAAAASSTTYCTVGRSRIGSSSLGTARAAGNMRVPNPAAGRTARRRGRSARSSASPRTAGWARGRTPPCCA